MNRRKILVFLSRWLGIGDVFDDDEPCHRCARSAWELDQQLRRVWPGGCVCIDEADCQAERDGIRLERFLELATATAG